MDSLIKS